MDMQEQRISVKGSGYSADRIHHEFHGGLNTHEQNFHVIGNALRYAGFFIGVGLIFLGISMIVAAWVIANA
jgi:hypothetical protein